MASIDPVSEKTKRTLNWLKVALTDEFDKEPTWDDVLQWMIQDKGNAKEKIEEEHKKQIGDLE